MYLYCANKKDPVLHLWTGSDTVCTLFSTGGMGTRNKRLTDKTFGRRVCRMCLNNSRKLRHNLDLTAPPSYDLGYSLPQEK